jgi:hypothetical protein
MLIYVKPMAPYGIQTRQQKHGRALLILLAIEAGLRQQRETLPYLVVAFAPK